MKKLKGLALSGLSALAIGFVFSGSLSGQNLYFKVNNDVRDLAGYVMKFADDLFEFDSETYGTSMVYRKLVPTEREQYLLTFTDRGFDVDGYDANSDGIVGRGDEFKISINPFTPESCMMIDKDLDGKVDFGNCSSDKRFRDREYLGIVRALLDFLGVN